MGGRRTHSLEFKHEAVKLIRERGVSAAQASRDLGVHANLLRKWVKDFEADPAHAFPGHGQMKPEQLENDRLRREVRKLKAEARSDGVESTRDLCGMVFLPLRNGFFVVFILRRRWISLVLAASFAGFTGRARYFSRDRARLRLKAMMRRSWCKAFFLRPRYLTR